MRILLMIQSSPYEEDQDGDFSHVLYTHCVKMWFSAEDDLNAVFTRAVVWALHVLDHQRRSGGRVSVVSVFLLLSDLLELILSSAIVILIMSGQYKMICDVFAGPVFGTRVCGHHLHQLVVLESILSLRPADGAVGVEVEGHQAKPFIHTRRQKRDSSLKMTRYHSESLCDGLAPTVILLGDADVGLRVVIVTLCVHVAICQLRYSDKACPCLLHMHGRAKLESLAFTGRRLDPNQFTCADYGSMLSGSVDAAPSVGSLCLLWSQFFDQSTTSVSPTLDPPLAVTAAMVDVPHRLFLPQVHGRLAAQLRNTMAQILFSVPEYYQHFWVDIQQERLAGKVRLSMFLIAGACGGLPTLAWALRVFYRHYKSGRQISASIIMLLCCDLLVLLLVPYIVTNVWQDGFCWYNMTCRTLSSLWAGSATYGLHLQQLVGLEGVLSLRYPVACDYRSCSIMFSIIALVCFSLCEFFNVDHLTLLGLPLLLAVTLTSWIVTCRAPPLNSDAPYRRGRSGSTVLALVTSTVVLYMVYASLCLVLRHYSGHFQDLEKYWTVWVMCLSLMSLRVIFDPLLCVLVYRRHLRAHTQNDTHKAQLTI
ncbi:hypothetical protein NFI96_004451 [Prochilodus magdalenae]|nr:hypothetical protein NFI96_004451 [Prochilodus magdalenae]